MRRDILKYSEEYRRDFLGATGNRGAFHLADITQIYNSHIKPLRRLEALTPGIIAAIGQAIQTALQAGFIAGYRYAKREEAERRKAGAADPAGNGAA